MNTLAHKSGAPTDEQTLADAGSLGRPWSILSEEYAAEAVIIQVYPVMIMGQLRLTPADAESEQALAELVQRLAQIAPDGVDPSAWAQEGADKLMARTFDDDVWFSEIPGAARVVLIKKASVPDAMSTSEVLRRVHLSQVSDALQAGLPVPRMVLDEYRSNLEAIGASRELPV